MSKGQNLCPNPALMRLTMRIGAGERQKISTLTLTFEGRGPDPLIRSKLYICITMRKINTVNGGLEKHKTMASLHREKN